MIKKIDKQHMSIVKWSDLVHSKKTQVNSFSHFHVPFFYIFLTPKITDNILKSTLLSFFCNI